MTIPRFNRPQVKRIKDIVKAFGGATHLAKILDIDRSNIHKWKTYIPAEHAIYLAHYSGLHKLGITIQQLRPDIYKRQLAFVEPTPRKIRKDCRKPKVNTERKGSKLKPKSTHFKSTPPASTLNDRATW